MILVPHSRKLHMPINIYIYRYARKLHDISIFYHLCWLVNLMFHTYLHYYYYIYILMYRNSMYIYIHTIYIYVCVYIYIHISYTVSFHQSQQLRRWLRRILRVPLAAPAARFRDLIRGIAAWSGDLNVGFQWKNPLFFVVPTGEHTKTIGKLWFNGI